MPRWGRGFIPFKPPQHEAPQPYPRTSSDSAGAVLDSADRSLSLTPSAADAIVVSEVATRGASQARSSAEDAVAVSDSAMISLMPADSIAISDDAERDLQALSRTAADSLSVSDSLVAALAAARSSDESALSISDDAQNVLANPRTGADSISVNDAVQVLLVVARAGTDSLSVSDSARRDPFSVRRASEDPLDVSDDAERDPMTRARGAADSMSVSDLAQRSPQALIRAGLDAIGAVTDSAHRTFKVFAADTILVTDSAGRLLTFARTAHDIVVVTDHTTHTGQRDRSATDLILPGADGAITILGAPRHAGDIIVVSDAAVHTRLHTHRHAQDFLPVPLDAAVFVYVQAEDVSGPRLRFHVRLEHPAGIVRIETLWARDLWEATSTLEAQFPGYTADWGEMEPLRRTGSGIQGVYPLFES